MTEAKQPGKGKSGSKSAVDALTKAKKSKIELTESDLKRVSGGSQPKPGLKMRP